MIGSQCRRRPGCSASNSTVYGLVDRGEIEAEVTVPTDRPKRRRSVRIRRQAVEDFTEWTQTSDGNRSCSEGASASR